MNTLGITLLIGLTGIVIAVIIYIKWKHDRKPLPRVTKKDFKKVEAINKELEEFKKVTQRIRKEYNLD